MFKIGDYVAHYKSGVCEVTDIGKLSISSDQNKDYYTLKPIYDGAGTLYTPVANERNQIREVITTERAKELIEEMPDIATLEVTDERKREATYKEALMRNACDGWIAIIKTSYRRKMDRIAAGKKVINVDDRYLTSAERFLYGELAVALGIGKDEVKKYIIDRIEI